MTNPVAGYITGTLSHVEFSRGQEGELPPGTYVTIKLEDGAAPQRGSLVEVAPADGWESLLVARPVDLDTVERVAREGALRHSLRDQCSCDSCREEHGPAGAPGRCGACPHTEHGDVCADSTAYGAILTAMGIQ